MSDQSQPIVKPQPIVEVEDLWVWLRKRGREIPLVRGLSYTLRPAEALSIVGESGAGKSIGVRAALGLLDPRLFRVTGSSKLVGTDVLALTAKERARYVPSVAALVFQDPGRSLNPTMRVGDQIAEAFLKGSGYEPGMTRAKAEARALQLMKDVRIAAAEERFKAYPNQLSGGMKQRVVIAIAVACKPQVLFCDEPTSSLDVTTQAAIMDLIGELRDQTGIATVTITHDLALAASRARKVIVMYGGQVVEALPARLVATESAMPYTTALIEAVPDIDGNGTPPTPIEGMPPDPANLPSGCSFHPRCRFAQDDCLTNTPELRVVAPAHELRCFHPVKDLELQEASR
ncbi:MAG: transporter ATP-binding protein [Subtercola sp.]|nr:transporter ATP-binding protein [Subtercola sp.]